MSNRLLRIVAALALAGVAGCAGKQWRVLPVSPDSVGSLPTEVRLTFSDGTRLVVTSPHVRNDSIFGSGEAGRVALPLSQVSRVAVEGPNPEKEGATKVMLVAAGITVLSIFALLLLAN